MLSVFLSALCLPAPLNFLTFWRYTNQIINIIIKYDNFTSLSAIYTIKHCILLPLWANISETFRCLH